jgi:hypothetical protein
MTRIGVAALTAIAMLGLGIEAQAAPCPEYLRLRDAAAQAWGQAMRGSPAERCGALNHTASAAQATLKFANNNRDSCGISASLLDGLEKFHRQTVQARDNACAGRPLRPYPPEIIQR